MTHILQNFRFYNLQHGPVVRQPCNVHDAWRGGQTAIPCPVEQFLLRTRWHALNVDCHPKSSDIYFFAVDSSMSTRVNLLLLVSVHVNAHGVKWTNQKHVVYVDDLEAWIFTSTIEHIIKYCN